jgi:hypothetical protein
MEVAQLLHSSTPTAHELGVSQAQKADHDGPKKREHAVGELKALDLKLITLVDVHSEARA